MTARSCVAESRASISRRSFLTTASSLALAATTGWPAFAAMGPNDKFDLLIKGGEVLDPEPDAARQARHRHPLRRDRSDREPTFPPARAQRVLDACGKLVTPGLIDLHCARLSVRLGDRHSGRRAGRASVHHDVSCRPATPAPTTSRRSAATSCRSTRTRLYAFVHIANRRPGAAFRCPSSTTSTSRRSTMAAQGRRRERRHGARRQGAHVRERDRQARPRAAQARDRGLRAVGRPAARSCATSAASRHRRP